MVFVKGKSGNPGGTNGVPEDLQLGRRLTRQHVESLLSHYLTIPLDKLRELGTQKDLRAIDAMIVQIAIKAIVNGDTLRSNFLLDRLIGKAREEMIVHNLDYVEALKVIPREELIRLAKGT